jgi:hypothetical protein
MRGQHSQEMCRRQGTVLSKEEGGRLSWKRRSSIPFRLYRTVEEIV